ncbi:MAG: D-alanyl-D-alanine carboxypeptidase family protein [Armatimonadota bacterium]
MTRLFTIWLCAVLLSPALAAPAPPKIGAKSAVLIDSITGTVLYEKNAHLRRPPASTTKMMTAILAIEHAGLEDKVTASKHASETMYSSLHLKPGEHLTMRNLLYGMLLRSANDGAVCVAEHVGGTEGEFVRMMNEKARQIGARETHFANPHGLYRKDHYSTAYDLALIARYAIRYPIFNEIVRTKRKRIERSINAEDVAIINTARFLRQFPGADGIKTGYTREAGYCFVGSATRNDWRLVSVVLASPNTCTDTSALLSYGFKHYKSVALAHAGRKVTSAPVRGGTREKVQVLAADNLGRVMRKNTKVESRTELDLPGVSAPIQKGEKLGTLTGYVNGKNIGTVDLIAGGDVERTFAATLWLCTRTALLFTALVTTGYIAYGTTVAKIARRRRRRLPARGGKINNGRTRCR